MKPNSRREFLKVSSLVGLMLTAGLITPAMAEQWNKAAFEAKGLNDAMNALGISSPANSSDITLNMPDIAENGAVVPVGVSTKLNGVSQIVIIVEKNPSALAAVFNLPEGAEGFVSTRVKMGQTSNVYALIKANGKWVTANKEVKVTLGGCGG